MTMKNYNHGRLILISSTFTSKFNVSRSRSFFFYLWRAYVSNFTYSPDYHSVNLTFYFKFEFCRACVVSLQTVMQIA